jgi:hypothetical protein
MHTDEKNTLPSQIDLNELAKRHDLRIIVEPQESESVRRARLAQNRLNAEYKRRKDWLLFRVALFAAVLFGGVCVLIVFTNGTSLNFAAAALSSLVNSAIAYLSGKSG